MRFLLTLTVFPLVFAIQLIPPAECEAQTLAFEFSKARLEGKPLEWSKQQMVIMHHDGQMGIYPLEVFRESKMVSERFDPIDGVELRSRLQRELGQGFQVTTTEHYVVAYRGDRGSAWASRFEQIYRGVASFASRRGFQVKDSGVPLIAIVFANQQEYHAYASRTNAKLPPQTAGFYSSLTNRIALFDPSRNSQNAQWEQILDATITHEAAHQAAYNLGLHKRLTDTPLWLAEGFATMCESQAVWDSAQASSETDRVNPYQREQFISLVMKRQVHGWLEPLIADRRLFETSPDLAYAAAWATAFYLSERQPREFGKLLKATSEVSVFSKVDSGEQIAQFKKIIGSNIRLIESKIEQYVSGIER
jgi:Protein of unknown function (DUF1570)